MHSNLSIRLFLLLFISIASNVISQSNPNNFNHDAELNNMVNIPNSPDAQAFAQYGNTSVNLYMGRPNIGVPLYIHKGKELNMPVALSYNASGIRGNQLAGSVGLSWNLGLGGRVSRIINGKPDEYQVINGAPYFTFWTSSVRNKINSYIDQGNWFNSKTDLENYLYFLKDVNDGKYDTQPDYYQVNAPGLNETVVFDINSGTPLPVALNNPRVKVTAQKSGSGNNTQINGWIITSDNGTKYYFGNGEITETRNHNIDDIEYQGDQYAWQRTYISSWVLTKIESPYKKDIYTFSYNQLAPWSTPQSADISQSHTLNLSGGPGSTENGGPTYTNLDIQYFIQEQRLQEVAHNGERIISFDFSSRFDISNSNKIDRLNVHKTYNSNPNATLMSVDFEYDYFTSGFETDPTTAPSSSLRLQLAGLQINNETGTESQEYHFEYTDNHLGSSINGYAVDYLGLINGDVLFDEEGILYPRINIPNVLNLTGANRDPIFHKAIRGMLSKIYYPTGGHTTFEYEPASTVELDYYSSQPVTIAQALLNTTGLSDNPYNPDACNATRISDQTEFMPHQASDFFEISSFEEGERRIRFSQNYTSNYTFWSISKRAFLIKLPDENTSYTFEDLYDSSCNSELQESIIWYYTNEEFHENAFNELGFKEIDLSTGHYQLLTVSPFPNSTFNLRVQKMVQDAPVYENVERAGIRIKTISDFSDQTTRVRKRLFEYPDGKVVFDAALTKYSYQEVLVDNVIENHQFIHRYASVNGGDKPHVVYPTVVESQLDENDQASNGSIIHKYYTENGPQYFNGIYLTPQAAVQSNINNYAVDFSLGQLKEKEIPAKRKSTYSYDFSDYEELRTIGIATNLNHSFKFTTLYQSPTTGLWTTQLVNGHVNPPGNGDVAHAGYINPPFSSDYPNTPIQILQDDKLASLFFRKSYARGRWGKMTNTTSVSSEGSQEMTQTTEYSYYGDEGFTANENTLGLLAKTQTTDSREELLESFTYYPGNLGGEYANLVTSNILTSPVKTEGKRDGQLMQTKTSHYSGLYPSTIEIQKGNSPSEERLAFERYDSNTTGKNLIQARKQDGNAIAYVYSYNRRYLVAQIENATFTEVASALGVSESILMDYPENNIANLNNLRSVLPLSQVTTYTYLPQVGIETMIDTRGYKLQYHYDDFHRLTHILDEDGKVVEKYNYNTRPYTPPDDGGGDDYQAMSAIGISYLVDNSTSNIVVNGSVLSFQGGEGPYTFQWQRKINDGVYTTISTTSNNAYSFSYNINDGNYCAEGQNQTITIRCIITDSTGETLDVYSTPKLIICHVDFE